MTLNATTCGDAVSTALAALTQTQKGNLNKVWETAIGVIFAHITANMAVSVAVPGTGLAAPSGGGPVTGSATGTGSVS